MQIGHLSIKFRMIKHKINIHYIEEYLIMQGLFIYMFP